MMLTFWGADENSDPSRKHVHLIVFGATAVVMGTLFIGFSLTTLLHELGHGLPALFYSRQPVSLLIGSHRETSGSFPVRLGRLTIWFTRNPLRWPLKGRCLHHPVSSRQIGIIVLSGPLLPLLVTSATLAFALMQEWVGGSIVALSLLTLAAALSAIVNLVPAPERQNNLYGGLLNDGRLLVNLVQRYRYRDILQKAAAAFEHEDYLAAATLYQSLVDKGLREPGVCWALMMAHYEAQHYAAAAEIYERLLNWENVSAAGHYAAAFIAIYAKRYELSRIAFERTLQLEPAHPTAFLNQGYSLSLLERYPEASAIYDQVLAATPDDGYALACRGWTKVQLGDEAEGVAEMQRGIALEPETNAYGYFLLGRHELSKGRVQEARTLFTKAQTIDASVHELGEWQAKAQAMVGA